MFHHDPVNTVELRRLLERPVPGVSEQISPAEKMNASNKPYYFWVGQSAVQLLRLALTMANKDEATVKHILDMPCGHGRVLRAIRAQFPNAHLTACDLLKDGVDFCAATFDAAPVYSQKNPAATMFPGAGKYDLIFVGSLFTHFDKPRWTEFLQLFNDLLAPGGLLLFTCHGPFVAYRMECGFNYGYTQALFGNDSWFARRLRPLRAIRRFLLRQRRPADSTAEPRAIKDSRKELDPKGPIQSLLRRYRQKDFGYVDDNRGFGISLSKPSWVLRQFEAFPDLRVVYYLERGWVAHQDAVAIVKRPFVSAATDRASTSR